MQKVTVQRDELLARLRENRENHRELFLEAQQGFRARVIQELDRRLDDAQHGRKIDQYLGLVEPQDHTKDYDRVITMVEMSIDGEIELTAADFSRFVMDDWEWKEAFTASVAGYAGIR